VTRLLLVLLLVAGAACSSTVYDAAGVPRLGALVCADPGTHACTALDVCATNDDVLHCESDCHACTTTVEGATPICVANTCGYECAPGRLKCATGCCAAAAITAGGDHACAIAAGTGELLCWGANNDGQLGIGDQTGADQPTPVKVPLPGKVIAASAGTAHSCAILEGGEVWCWGRKSSYASGAEYDYYPVAVPALGGTTASGTTVATAVAAGGGHSCAMRDSATAKGEVKCAGAWNPGGISGVPVASGATSIAAADDFSCAIANGVLVGGVPADGVVVCWGANEHGQLGNTGEIPQPAAIPLAGPVSTMALGTDHGCAADAQGRVRCWSVRIGLSSDPSMPYVLDDVAYPVRALAGGAGHTCALREPASDGIECWGNTASDPVIGGTATAVGAPVKVPVASPATAIDAGLNHTCAIDGGGSLVCWGHGERGQLGDGGKVDSAAPVAVVSR
jgi:alpha-tubulin suppressor-like RCC1 family protein